MDFPGFVRRLSVSDPPVRNSPGLTVDTNVLKNYRSKMNSLSSIATKQNMMEPQWQDGDHSPEPVSRSTTPVSARSNNSVDRDDYHMRRRRSNSECLLLAKKGGQELPGQCKEYITSVKQILARSEDTRPELRRRSSAAQLKSAAMFK